MQTDNLTPFRLTALLGAHAWLRVLSSAASLLAGWWLLSSGIAAGRGVAFAGTLGVAAYGAELVAAVPLGVAADAVAVRALMGGGALLTGLSLLLFQSAQGPIRMIVSRVLAGVGVAAVSPPLLQLLTRRARHAPALRARLMSGFELSMLAGLALGALLAAQLWSRLRAEAFVLAALGCLLGGVVLFGAAGDDPGGGGVQALRQLRSTLSDPIVRALLPAWLCMNAIVGLWLGPTLTYLLTATASAGRQWLPGRFATSPGDLGWWLLGYAMVFGLGVGLWSVWLPRCSLQVVLRVALLAMLGVCALLYAVNHSAGVSVPVRWLLGALTALLIMVESGFSPAALAWLAGALQRGSGPGAAMGVYSMLFSLGGLAGSALAGVLGQFWRIDGLLLGTVLLALAAQLLLPRSATGDALGVRA